MPVATRKGSAEVKKIEEPADSERDAGWRVILFNCECHSFDQVEDILLKAVRCSLSQARAWSFEVHSKGSAVVYQGALERCRPSPTSSAPSACSSRSRSSEAGPPLFC